MEHIAFLPTRSALIDLLIVKSYTCISGRMIQNVEVEYYEVWRNENRC